MQELHKEGFELSPQQKRVWAFQDGDQVPYARMVLRLDRNLDVDRIRHALDAIVNRYEILRTTYQRSPGMKLPLQVVNPPNPNFSGFSDSAVSCLIDRIPAISCVFSRLS